jgi:hypothetical protein
MTYQMADAAFSPPRAIARSIVSAGEDPDRG